MNKVYVLLVGLAFLSCNQPDKKIAEKPPETLTRFAAPKDWKTLERDNYSIQYPATWSEDDKFNDMGFRVYASEDSITTRFKPKITLTILDLKGAQLNFDDFERDAEEQVTKVYTKASIVESKRIKIDSIEYHELLVAFDNNAGIRMEHEAWECYINGKIYGLVLLTEKAGFENYQKLGENIMSTFTIRKQ